ncbi:mitochondrial intermembrane space import and assembly protein 40 [Tripterygium wilfordii]|uniref:Mitochondrial intermembrane space import and assembly protein 40 homolog n=1 Tax=Tripterygium wilfordii TaxID=458696 RepID=A0A7J7CV69_TRIWF|nr:mitochondrial intermembrane space import and assembly protein 40 homolog [Tripterygium wilfordii]KAF5737961.1 mitochondrial intermembrane space import and assembly protein 40 [Tripterygium wilfordii]
MGQAQSEVAADQTQSEQSSAASSVTPRNSQAATSMESLIAEAVAYGNEADESLDAKAQKALECPCIADLRNGPCGVQFSEAFLCFLKSTADEKGSDCVHPFVALQDCIKANPNAFSEDVLEDDEDRKKEEPTEEYKINPPSWAKDRPSSKSKL